MVMKEAPVCALEPKEGRLFADSVSFGRGTTVTFGIMENMKECLSLCERPLCKRCTYGYLSPEDEKFASQGKRSQWTAL